MSTLKEIWDSGDLAGYVAGAPSSEASDSDAAVAGAAPCLVCGAVMGYEGYIKVARGTNIVQSYRAFAVCTNPACGHAVEF